MGNNNFIIQNIDTNVKWKYFEIKIISFGIVFAGLALILRYLPSVNPFANSLILTFMVMNAFADSMLVTLPNGINISLNFPIMFCVLLLYGPEAALWVYIPGSLINHIVRQKESYRAIFNISQIAISIFITSLILPKPMTIINLKQDWLIILIAVIVFDLVNISLVVKMVTIMNNVKFFAYFTETWIQEMSAVRPIYYAAGIIMAICYQVQGLLGALIVIAPLLGVFFQLRSQKELKTQTSRANTDALTGLANRYALSNWWEQQLPIILNNNKNLSVLMLDIDDFKKVNDTYGHNVGDGVLKSVANILKDTIRCSDCIYRFGGEEFVVLLPESTIKEAQLVAERIRQSIDNLAFPHLSNISITVSLGLSSINERIIEEQFDIPDELIRRADKAMYVAKQNGKNQVQIYS